MLSWKTTLIVLGVALGSAGLANWQLRRPLDRRWLKLAPWTGIQFVALVVAVLMVAHVATLATGKPFGRGY